MDRRPRARLRILIPAALTLVLVLSFAVALAGPSGSGTPSPTAQSAARPAPRLLSPADEARVEVVPAFSWRRDSRAKEYQFQIAADSAFESILAGTGTRRGSFKTKNTFATLERALPDGTYYWRVRAIDSRDRAGRWSRPREFVKRWSLAPELLGPTESEPVVYPTRPLVLRWSRVPHAHRYLVTIASDPSLASLVGDRDPIETEANVLSPRYTLPPGRYYWGVTPVDTRGHRGTPSVVGSFTWNWPTSTTPSVRDANAEPGIYEPEFSWDPVAGAAEYQVEVNASEDFATGSKVCCDAPTTATTHTPPKVFANNTYYWRVRALDVDGNPGQWNAGPNFQKDFDVATPTIPGLHLRDNDDASLPLGSVVNHPVLDWDPVPGAASYNVQVVPFESGACNWTSTSGWNILTATTAWTPLSESWNGRLPGGVEYPRASKDNRKLNDDQSYCARVLARTDRDGRSKEVVSDWTQLGTSTQPSFTYDAPVIGSPATTPLVTPDANYVLPQTGTLERGMPLFTWQPVPGAQSYFVVIAKDQAFTEIRDVAITRGAAYAPRNGGQPHTYPDETTLYYWAVIPALQGNGDGVGTTPQDNSPHSFQKQSVPPDLLAPADGTESFLQPTFRWSFAHGAREYRVQVSQDPTFGDPVEDVLTNSTSYTSAANYPADTSLYWRVRANDETKIGLTWSRTGNFRRRLEAPTPSPNIPAGGETIPPIEFSPVQGAVSYDIHVDQVDGTDREFNSRSPVFTPHFWYGNGVWHFQVRANFKTGLSIVPGPWSQRVPFARRIGTPAGAHAIRQRNRVLMSWDPVIGAKEYKVEISTTDGFSRVIESARVDGTTFAPLLNARDFGGNGPLYWRVTPIAEGNNPGGAVTSALRTGRPMRITVRGSLRARRSSTVTVRVTGSRRRAVRGAQVEVIGAGRVRPKRTNRRGVVRYRIRAARRTVRFRATKRGYRTTQKVVRVR